MRTQIAPTICDLAPAISQAAGLIDSYLRTHFQPSVDGFFPSRLSGDEDPDTAKLCEALFPLVNVLTQLRAIDTMAISLATKEEYARTWHSNQYAVLGCTGEESDAKIAGIYRQSIR